MKLRLALLISTAALLTACAQPEVRDGPPAGSFDPTLIKRPEPRPEPPSAYGNHTPYEVLGQRYHVMNDAREYREQGIASWYGRKFHGRPTSSGEPYDVHQLTAAHRSLPLPTWVEVTRLDTGKSVVVRVNDRGPFHPDRIIDLSWAAASELDMIDLGTARVEVRAISFDDAPGLTARPARLPVYVQVGAFAEQARALDVERRLVQSGIGPIETERARTSAGRVWRVRLGPVSESEAAISLIDRIAELGLGPARYVYP